MCGAYSTSYHKTEQTICVVNPMCRQYGLTVVPWGNTANSEQQYKDMEQDMCNESEYWHLTISSSMNTKGHYKVEFSRKDGKTADQFMREFDNFGDALAFANGQYEILK